MLGVVDDGGNEGRRIDPDGAGLAPASVAKTVQVFNKGMRAAVEDRLISTNPVERLPLPKLRHEERCAFSTSKSSGVSPSVIDQRYRALALLGGYGGLRIGEMLGLRWGRVDLERGRIDVVEGLTDLAGAITFGPPKTKAAIRPLTVPRFVTSELASLIEGGADPNQLVFRSPDGCAVRPVLLRRRFWNPAVAAADLAPLRIHDLRRTAVALWIAAGANPKVAVRAGHSSVSVVVDRYGHLFSEQDDALVSALESVASAFAPIARMTARWLRLSSGAHRLGGAHRGASVRAYR